MSAGDLNTPNGKKNNFHYQFNVLRLLGAIQGNTDQVEAILQDIDNNTDGIEPLLSQILATLQSGADYEAFFVDDANGVTWLEVRIYNPDTGTWDPITYYSPGSLTPGTPTAPLTYVSPGTLLAQILAELVGHTALLTDIENNTDGLETTLTNLEACCTAGNLLLQNIDAKDFATETTLAAFAAANNTALGLIESAVQTADSNIVAAIQACCTSQATILSNILTELQSQTGLLTTIDSNTALVLAELVAQTVQNSTIITALGTLATETTLASVLTELQGINLDTNGLSQEATQLLVLAALSGLATETTLNALLTAFNAENFATETTLAAILTILGNLTFTGSDLNVSANIQVGGTDVSGANPVPVTLPTATHTLSLTRVASSGPGASVAAGAFEVSFFNAGTITNTVNGASLLPGERVTYRADVFKTLPSIPYSAAAGSDLVISITI